MTDINPNAIVPEGPYPNVKELDATELSFSKLVPGGVKTQAAEDYTATLIF